MEHNILSNKTWIATKFHFEQSAVVKSVNEKNVDRAVIGFTFFLLFDKGNIDLEIVAFNGEELSVLALFASEGGVRALLLASVHRGDRLTNFQIHSCESLLQWLIGHGVQQRNRAGAKARTEFNTRVVIAFAEIGEPNQQQTSNIARNCGDLFCCFSNVSATIVCIISPRIEISWGKRCCCRRNRS